MNDTEQFDVWRRDYDSMSDTDQALFYEEMYLRYPSQTLYDLDSVIRFTEYLPDGASVFEFGGWRGELAKAVLERDARIEKWHNFDVCRKAVAESVCQDPRYHGRPCHFSVWSVQWPGYDTLVASHSIEHIKCHQFFTLLFALPNLRWVYVDAPFLKDGETWNGYFGSHVYDVSWPTTIERLAECGFTEVASWSTDRSKAYAFEREQ